MQSDICFKDSIGAIRLIRTVQRRLFCRQVYTLATFNSTIRQHTWKAVQIRKMEEPAKVISETELSH